MMSPISLAGAAMQGVLQRQHFLSLELHRGRVSPRRKGHPSSLELLESYDWAVGPSVQARDTAQQEEEKERDVSDLRKVTIQRRKKRVCSSIKMDFYEIKKWVLSSLNECVSLPEF